MILMPPKLYIFLIIFSLVWFFSLKHIKQHNSIPNFKSTKISHSRKQFSTFLIPIMFKPCDFWQLLASTCEHWKLFKQLKLSHNFVIVLQFKVGNGTIKFNIWSYVTFNYIGHRNGTSGHNIQPTWKTVTLTHPYCHWSKNLCFSQTHIGLMLPVIHKISRHYSFFIDCMIYLICSRLRLADGKLRFPQCCRIWIGITRSWKDSRFMWPPHNFSTFFRELCSGALKCGQVKFLRSDGVSAAARICLWHIPCHVH